MFGRRVALREVGAAQIAGSGAIPGQDGGGFARYSVRQTGLPLMSRGAKRILAAPPTHTTDRGLAASWDLDEIEAVVREMRVNAASRSAAWATTAR